MDVISPIPIAPQATLSPGFSTIILSTSGTLFAFGNPSVPYFAVGLQSLIGYFSVVANPNQITTPTSI